jgi:hypothetical protein
VSEETCVANLPPAQLDQFRVWFKQFDAERFDQRILRDAMEGNLDDLATQAVTDYRAGQVRPL